jgi:hypothetical protein
VNEILNKKYDIRLGNLLGWLNLLLFVLLLSGGFEALVYLVVSLVVIGGGIYLSRHWMNTSAILICWAFFCVFSYYQQAQIFDQTMDRSHMALILALEKYKTQFGSYPNRLVELEKSSSIEELKATHYKEYDDSGETCVYPCYQKSEHAYRIMEGWIPPGNCILEFGKSSRFECAD